IDETDFAGPGMSIYLRVALGDREGAMRSARISLERAERVVAADPNNGHALAFGVGALAALGEQDRAKEWMSRALLLDPDNLLARYNFACTLVVDFHDLDAALEMLSPVFENVPISLLSHAKVDVDLDPLRADPRFQSMLADAEARLKAKEASA